MTLPLSEPLHAPSAAIDYSVVGPAFNEAGNLEEFVSRCLQAFEAEHVRGEVVLVDDGSTDASADVFADLVNAYPHTVRVIRHRCNRGLTQALQTGFVNARGEHIIWISPDLESYPDTDIPRMIASFREGADVVVGCRRHRGDGKRFSSKIYNVVSNYLFGTALRDMNWIKGFRRICLPALELRGDWHRFMVIMLSQAGYRIVETEVDWHPRRYGRSKFGLRRFPLAVVDVLSLWFLLKFSQKPMRLFGTVGTVLVGVGLLLHGALTMMYLIWHTQIRPFFWTALVFEMMGVFFLLFGFLAELVERLRHEFHTLFNTTVAALPDPDWVEIQPTLRRVQPPSA
ncbi:MAG: glycosyltransferase [Deltaproteobacteria bacterium]|nr:glycosyltransferase [Deltaproteobacteria bacterium]